MVCLNSVVQEIICTCNWSLWPRPQINTGTSINHRCPDLTPLRLFKNRQFWPDVYTQDDKTRISKLKQTGNQACKQILIHGFLKHSVLRLIVSLIVLGATFQARKVTLSKYFSLVSVIVVGSCAELLVALQRKPNSRPYSQYAPSLYALKDWWDKRDVTWFLRCKHVKKLSIRVIAVQFVYSLSKRDEDFIVMQNVHMAFWQDLRHYCLPWGHLR